MGNHSTKVSLKLFDFLIELGNRLDYLVDTEYPMSETVFGSQAIDIAWFNEEKSQFPLFIFEIESSTNNSIANNPTKVFGKESKGLSEEVLEQFENHLTIPMSNLIRSFNIANSVAFVIGDFGKEVEHELIKIAESIGAKGKIFHQEKALGTAHAIYCAAESLTGNCMIAFADTLFKADFTFNENEDGYIWVMRVDDPTAYGVVNLNDLGR